MSAAIPKKTSVLVIGGGPGGAYTAICLAREGIDVTVLELEKFPRYHVGESMVPSIRHFLKQVDLDEKFKNHGFIKKTGGAFKLVRGDTKHAYTDFILNTGGDTYAWNVIRSESDELILNHAKESGAKVIDECKVTDIQFEPLEGEQLKDEQEAGQYKTDLGRPVSATWSHKDGNTGKISFDYVVDASGRVGIISTKYLKNRSFNGELKNVASWGYWKGAISYGLGTQKEGQPFFEAMDDGSGWVWFIPLHNGTTSVGVVMNQQKATAKKQALDLSPVDFYKSQIRAESPGISALLEKADLATELKHASDWSYSATQYGGPNFRIVGDAGAFIDPYFSSGCHLALSGAQSAAVTIAASIKKQVTEQFAWEWHSALVTQRYTRFLLVVLGATKQIRHQDVPVLNDAGTADFDDVFSMIRPVIQGIDEVDGATTGAEVDAAVAAGAAAVGRETSKTAVVTGQEAVTDSNIKGHESGVLTLVKQVLGDSFAENKYKGMSANTTRGSFGLDKSLASSSLPQHRVINVDINALLAKKAEEDKAIVGTVAPSTAPATIA